jgi:hypothetical protein
MGKLSRCPGCRHEFLNGRAYSMHLTCCKALGPATDSALKKHKIHAAKKAQAKQLDIAARKELAAQAVINQGTLDQDMDTNDVNEVLAAQNSPSPPPRPSGRPNRRIRLPLRYRDDLPPNPNPPIISVSEDIVDYDDEPVETVVYASPDSIPMPKAALFCTETNSFGVYRKYSLGPPTITPDESFTLSSISDSLSIAHDPADSRSKASWWSSFGPSCPEAVEKAIVEKPAENYYAPFLNPSTFRLMSWYYNGSSTKSYANVDKLIHDVIRHEDFKASDFGASFSTAREAGRMDKNQPSKSSVELEKSGSLPFKPEDGWIQASVSIPVPCDGFNFKSEEDAPRFVVDGIWYRQPLEVIKLAFSEPAAENFHITPFKEYWKPSKDEPEERIYSETFTADVFNEEYERLRTTSREAPNSELEPFIAGIMFYSDTTHLANFGTACLYPMYMYIGNQSQYTRAKPSEFTAHHIAYIPKVFIFQVTYRLFFYFLTNCKARRQYSRILHEFF